MADELEIRALKAYCKLLEWRLDLAKQMIEGKNNILARLEPSLCLAYNHAKDEDDKQVFNNAVATCQKHMADKWKEG